MSTVIAKVTPLIEGTILDRKATGTQYVELAKATKRLGWAGACVYPEGVSTVAHCLKDSSSIPVSVVGFPDGNIDTSLKVIDARDAVRWGAKELDMVIRVDALRAGDDHAVIDDIMQVATVAHDAGLLIKVILECGVLTREQITLASGLAIRAGADFIKRSTGKEPEANRIKDDSVRFDQLMLMRFVAGQNISHFYQRPIGIKDSGQIRTLETCQGSFRNGATRLGIGIEAALKISQEETI